MKRPIEILQVMKFMKKFSNPGMDDFLQCTGLCTNPAVARMASSAMDLIDGRVTVEELDYEVSGQP
jgi:hypothetical protein